MVGEIAVVESQAGVIRGGGLAVHGQVQDPSAEVLADQAVAPGLVMQVDGWGGEVLGNRLCFGGGLGEGRVGGGVG